jgi:hypothetical protein
MRLFLPTYCAYGTAFPPVETDFNRGLLTADPTFSSVSFVCSLEIKTRNDDWMRLLRQPLYINRTHFPSVDERRRCSTPDGVAAGDGDCFPVILMPYGQQTSDLRVFISFLIPNSGYKNNVKVGEATVIMHGKGRFNGRHIRKFNIEHQD